MNRFSCGAVIQRNVCQPLAPSTRDASARLWSSVAIPVRKMMVLVPIIENTKVSATASSAVRSPARKSVEMKPSPTVESSELSWPWAAKNRSATIPITTHEIAVGRK